MNNRRKVKIQITRVTLKPNYIKNASKWGDVC